MDLINLDTPLPEMENKYPFKVGDKVIFDPDEHFYGWHVMLFDSFGIYPGKVITIERMEKDPNGWFICVKDEPGGWFPCVEFRRFNPDEKCPFKVGDLVRFTPSERTLERFEKRFKHNIPKPGKNYVVRRVINNFWIIVGGRILGLWVLTKERDNYGFYWKDYTLVKKK